MKIGEVRRFIDEWHCGLRPTIKSDKYICDVETMQPFLILKTESKCDTILEEREWVKVLFKGKVGFIVVSDAITEIVT